MLKSNEDFSIVLVELIEDLGLCTGLLPSAPLHSLTHTHTPTHKQHAADLNAVFNAKLGSVSDEIKQ